MTLLRPSRVLLTIIIAGAWKGFRTEFLFIPGLDVNEVEKELLKVVLAVGIPILYMVLLGSYSSST
jgi:hypothetical protein